MLGEVTTKIDESKCTGCGLCVKVCPADTLTMVDGKAKVTGNRSLGCEHCVAVCPVDAVTVGSVDPAALAFETLPACDRYVKPGHYDTAGLVELMRSRRSCRDFSPEPVPADVLRDLIRIGTTAPSGTNSQLWTFSVLPDRASVLLLGDAILAFFVKLNKMAESGFARLVSRIFLKDTLGQYYRDYYESVKTGIRQFREENRDRLFHGAPAVVAIGTRPGASCPSEDALLASQNICLAAHAMGYGTCLIGFAVEAMRNDPKIKDVLRIPRKEPVYSVIALGKSREHYRKTTGRRMPTVRMR